MNLFRAIALTAAVGCVPPTDYQDSPDTAVPTGIRTATALPMVVGENLSLPGAYYVNSHGNELQFATTPAWTSRDSTVAKIEAGRVYAGANPATTYIVVQAQGFSDSSLVTVDANFVTWPDTTRLIPGGARLLSVRAGKVAPGSRAVPQTAWVSSNPAVATVAGDGTVTALTTGVVSIIAQRGDYTAATRVVVANYPRQLSFTDFGIGPRGICAMEAAGPTWCWGDERPIDGTQADRCLDVGYNTAHTCSASPIMMSSIPFAAILSAKLDPWVASNQAPVGPYALSTDGRYFRLGETGPEPLAAGMQFKAVWAGSPLCGATLDGSGYCWALNFQGLMGNGTAQLNGPWPNTPQQVAGGIHWTQFARGQSMCGLADDGVVYCWGPNDNFETGIGMVSTAAPGCVGGPCITVPTAVATTARFTQIAGGTAEVCGIATDAALYCWGRGGTSGGGPYRVTSAPPFVTLYGNNTICGVDANGGAYCMHQSSSYYAAPPFPFDRVNLPFPVKKIMVGAAVSCASSAANGKLYCWGTGALGAGESAATATEINPVEVWGQRPPA